MVLATLAMLASPQLDFQPLSLVLTTIYYTNGGERRFARALARTGTAASIRESFGVDNLIFHFD